MYDFCIHGESASPFTTLQSPIEPFWSATSIPCSQLTAVWTTLEKIRSSISSPNCENRFPVVFPSFVSAMNMTTLPSLSRHVGMSAIFPVSTCHFLVPFIPKHASALCPWTKIRPSCPMTGFSVILNEFDAVQRFVPDWFTSVIFLSFVTT